MSGTTNKSIGALTVVVAAFGGAVLLASAASAAVTGVQRIGPQSGQLTADAAGARAVDLEVDRADMRVEFGDVERIELRVEGAAATGWTLRRDGDQLEVRGPDRGFDWWSPDWLRGEERATLVLPDELRGLDGDFSVQAGALRVDGVFDELEVGVDAGALTVDGSARDLVAELNAGSADIALSGVATAEYNVNAGRAVSTLSDAPDTVVFSVSAGDFDLTVPDRAYDVRRDVSAGSLDSRLDESASSSHRISGSVSAGSATLRAGDRAE
ncbi:hypothetical protein [Microbacterium sp. USHLN186]|uniref:hypothetical protein n=1 Tax=Microbacterium sp. USHLN186 TaxID=3081286 RepID=UPI003017578A